ncbi:hypothetical protein ANAEL_05718 [Anaerolineales bacterium]|nr:hypothetical protein ANAEL_05718 [Anaerolineales bacterium]
MSAEERRKILQMVADGKISAEEAATLMRSLEESAEEEIQAIEAESASGGERVSAPEFDQVRERAKLFAWIPLGVGIILTILTSWWMFSILQKAGLNFWFFCMTLPFFLGILLIALGAGGRSLRWLYVNVDRSRQNDWPKNITLALPLPLGLAGWFLKNFGSHLQWDHVDEILTAISAAKTTAEPLIVNVDESDNGERVQVFIG